MSQTIEVLRKDRDITLSLRVTALFLAYPIPSSFSPFLVFEVCADKDSPEWNQGYVLIVCSTKEKQTRRRLFGHFLTTLLRQENRTSW